MARWAARWAATCTARRRTRASRAIRLGASTPRPARNCCGEKTRRLSCEIFVFEYDPQLTGWMRKLGRRSHGILRKATERLSRTSHRTSHLHSSALPRASSPRLCNWTCSSGGPFSSEAPRPAALRGISHREPAAVFFPGPRVHGCASRVSLRCRSARERGVWRRPRLQGFFRGRRRRRSFGHRGAPCDIRSIELLIIDSGIHILLLLSRQRCGFT